MTKKSSYNRLRRDFRLFGNVVPIGLILTLLLSGCSAPVMLRPASDNASSITNLTWWIMGLALLVFLVVEGLLLYTASRYKGRHGAPLPRQIAGNLALEIGWTAFPAVVLAIIFTLTLGTLRSLYAAPGQTSAETPPDQPPPQVHVRVIGHQWWWEFQYPDLNIITANEIHLPVGTTVLFDIESADVIHSFWIPELGSKMDALPGRVNKISYHITKPGRYLGNCSEYCGTEHALMRQVVIVEPFDQYQLWVRQMQTPPKLPSPDVSNGLKVFNSQPCRTCHMLEGTNANGRVGPNLTHYGSRTTFAGASFDNTQENLTRWLINPQEMKPGNLMPNLGIYPKDAADLAAFLLSLK